MAIMASNVAVAVDDAETLVDRAVRSVVEDPRRSPADEEEDFVAWI